MSNSDEVNFTGEAEIEIHNKIAHNFRSVHVDGAYGGVTTRGFINLNFFSERGAIPKSSTFKVNLKNHTIEKTKDSEDSKEGIIREYDFGIYLSLDTSKKLLKLLEEAISELENQKEQ